MPDHQHRFNMGCPAAYEIDVAESLSPEAFEDEFETIGDYHRKAAHYFSQAAKHHLAAAAADDEG